MECVCVLVVCFLCNLCMQDQAIESAEMTKEQKAKRKMMEAVAKHLRFKVPTKNAVIKGQKVEYFQGD